MPRGERITTIQGERGFFGCAVALDGLSIVAGDESSRCTPSARTIPYPLE
ncbi:MAG TPA: hypothetical protein VJ123_03975 [Anaerolineales bacterium]|nr:hypothetical protein [Anaerolineales bacterium]